MIKKLLVLLTTISINAADMKSTEKFTFEGHSGQYELVGKFSPVISVVEILKAKYDLDFKNGKAVNEHYLAIADHYSITVYKKVKQFKRHDAFSEKLDSNL